MTLVRHKIKDKIDVVMVLIVLLAIVVVVTAAAILVMVDFQLRYRCIVVKLVCNLS